MKTKMGFEVERASPKRFNLSEEECVLSIYLSNIWTQQQKISYFLSVFNIIFDRKILIVDGFKGGKRVTNFLIYLN